VGAAQTRYHLLRAKVFDADGALVDDAIRGQVEKYMTGFARFVAKHVGAR
jgi:hypothetical protein